MYDYFIFRLIQSANQVKTKTIYDQMTWLLKTEEVSSLFWSFYIKIKDYIKHQT